MGGASGRLYRAFDLTHKIEPIDGLTRNHGTACDLLLPTKWPIQWRLAGRTPLVCISYCNQLMAAMMVFGDF